MTTQQKPRKENLTSTSVNNLQPEKKTYRVWDSKLQGLFIQVSDKGTKTYYVRYKLTGQKSAKDYKLGRHDPLTPDMARKEAMAKLGEVARGVDIQAEKKADRQRVEKERNNTLGAFIYNLYRPWAVQHKKNGSKDLARVDSIFSQWYGLPLTDITERRIDTWRTAQLKRKRAPDGINRDVTSLKGILTKAVRFNIIESSPLRNLKPLPLDKNKRVRYLNPEEEKRLRKALDDFEANFQSSRTSFNQWLSERGLEVLPTNLNKRSSHVRPIVLLALNTGMRKDEIFNLKWAHIDWKNNTIMVAGESSKSGQTRYIPMTKEARQILKDWRKLNTSSLFVFPSPKTGEKLDNIDSSWTTVRKLAGFPTRRDDPNYFRFHDLRHCFASNLVMAGVDLNKVRELLGHASIDMTLKYAHLAPESKAQAIATLDNYMEKNLDSEGNEREASQLSE